MQNAILIKYFKLYSNVYSVLLGIKYNKFILWKKNYDQRRKQQ